MSGMLAGFSGKLSKILSLLPADMLARMARLDVNLSSRAPADTAVSNTILTPARAALLDNLTGPLSDVKLLPRAALLLSGSSWNKPAKMAGSFLLVSMIGGGGAGQSSANPNGGGSGVALQRILYNVGAGPVPYAVGAGTSAGGTAQGGTTTFGTLSVAGGRSGGQGGGTVAGPAGFMYSGTGAHAMAQVHGGPFAGPAGFWEPSSSVSPGAGGLIFDDMVRAQSYDGHGYGAGGRGASSGGGAGKQGAIYLEWLEVP